MPFDNLKAIDNKYDGFDLEFVLGRKKVYISTEAWKVSMTDGKMVKTFDPYDTLYYHLPENNEGKPIISDTNGRTQMGRIYQCHQRRSLTT